MHRAILLEQCTCCFAFLGTRLMIKPNNQLEAPDVIFQSSARRVEMVVLGVDGLQLGCRGLCGYPSKSVIASDLMPCKRVSAVGGLQILTERKADTMQK